MKRLFKILAFIAVIYGVAIYGGFAPMPFKVTDPSDPRFNINRFRFEDYPTRVSLRNAIQKIFPIGTPVEDVDRVLVKVGGAKKTTPAKYDSNWDIVYDHPEKSKIYFYNKLTLRSWAISLMPIPVKSDRMIRIEIDDDKKIILIRANR